MISVLILTKNEAQDLPGALASVAWSDDIHVFDSFSTDGTVDIARANGAHLHQREFDNYAAQRNASLREPRFRHEWVLVLDADERIPPALKAEMLSFLRNAAPDIAACRMRRRDFLGTTWLRHSQLSPYYIRLVRPSRVHYEREVNEILRVGGSIHEFSEAFDHFPFSKGMTHWLAKHNVYSSLEAKYALEREREGALGSWIAAFTTRDFNERRVHQKALFYRLPMRPVVKFLLMYFGRLGFLDGRAGLTYALLQSMVEYMIVLKTRELAENGRAGGDAVEAKPTARRLGA
jgi:glycosyltransferase involved in cell wall biosynthesis